MTLGKTKHNYFASLFMCGCLFFIFGFVSWVNSILIPYFKVACDLHNEVLSYLVAFAFYIAYLLMSIPALCRAKRLFCVVPAATKAWAVNQTINGEISEQCPASIMRLHDNATLYVDNHSSELLNR